MDDKYTNAPITLTTDGVVSAGSERAHARGGLSFTGWRWKYINGRGRVLFDADGGERNFIDLGAVPHVGRSGEVGQTLVAPAGLYAGGVVVLRSGGSTMVWAQPDSTGLSVEGWTWCQANDIIVLSQPDEHGTRRRLLTQIGTRSGKNGGPIGIIGSVLPVLSGARVTLADAGSVVLAEQGDGENPFSKGMWLGTSGGTSVIDSVGNIYIFHAEAEGNGSTGIIMLIEPAPGS